MPPRRSNPPAAPVAEVEPPKPPKPREDDTLSVEDLNLPKSIVQRLAKGVLPPNTQIHKDALLAMSKGATVFVNYLTSAAAEEALRSGRKSVMPNDVFAAMRELEFEFMLPRLEAEVSKFTSIQADKRNTYRKKIRDEKRAKNDPDGVSVMTNGETSFMSVGTAGVDGEEPRAKKARLDGEVEGSDDEGVDEAQDVEDEEVEEDEIVEDEAPEDDLKEDPLEDKEDKEEDDEMADDSD
ncbi:histone-fold-containing protein [Didymella exigua CBS 183.55]|uniref:DNA polymerase epsilon subunit D n=1 Tax=Didymella exigua CBS 183.55 TaxID=1150837 RepID=A0A6A5RB94_9PLEO|nr:histone-fold-containing protein [Didymella exigua CBS 183.55]KAF1924468.1 histone-fold-containing protein [Didymella exigua CBS 183.55]